VISKGDRVRIVRDYRPDVIADSADLELVVHGDSPSLMPWGDAILVVSKCSRFVGNVPVDALEKVVLS